MNNIHWFAKLVSLVVFVSFSAASTTFKANNLNLSQYQADAQLGTNKLLTVALERHKESSVTLQPKATEHWDFSQYHGLSFVIENTGPDAITTAIKLTDANSNKWQFVDTSVYLEAGESKAVLLPFLVTDESFKQQYPQIKKMNAGPATVLKSWKGVDLTKVNQIRFSHLNEKGHHYRGLANISFTVNSITPYTLDQLYSYPKAPKLPFVDKFGQYMQAQYEGKLIDASQWQEREAQELADLKLHKGPAERSKWGGWLKGPKQSATGYFYTKQIDDKWWLVDPDGYLFWSHGVTGVGTKGARTLIKGREHYFNELPNKRGAYADFYHQSQFDFTQANLYRKYGENWRQIAIQKNHQRLKSWGMNTYGNWSQPENFGEEKTPFTVAVHYKSKMLEEKFPDPWDKNFAHNIKQALIAKKRDEDADSPWNIGFFVDNELHFYHPGAFANIITSAEKNQPAKLFFVEHLKKKYDNIKALNRAWGTTFASFNALLTNRDALSLQVIGDDGKWFYQQLVDEYYRVCRDSVKSIFPNHLYLGSRVHGDTNEIVLRAAEKYADVISYNLYHRNLKDFTSRLKDLSKPLMATEFHFGALDRGVFHTGLQGVSNQAERAQHYYQYVKSALENPLFVGTHWFQYRAQAITGRGDGENYQIGLVDVTDTPYPETIKAVREIGYKLYQTRWQNNNRK